MKVCDTSLSLSGPPSRYGAGTNPYTLSRSEPRTQAPLRPQRPLHPDLGRASHVGADASDQGLGELACRVQDIHLAPRECCRQDRQAGAEWSLRTGICTEPHELYLWHQGVSSVATRDIEGWIGEADGAEMNGRVIGVRSEYMK